MKSLFPIFIGRQPKPSHWPSLAFPSLTHVRPRSRPNSARPRPNAANRFPNRPNPVDKANPTKDNPVTGSSSFPSMWPSNKFPLSIRSPNRVSLIRVIDKILRTPCALCLGTKRPINSQQDSFNFHHRAATSRPRAT
jgi:hypothetical protein